MSGCSKERWTAWDEFKQRVHDDKNRAGEEFAVFKVDVQKWVNERIVRAELKRSGLKLGAGLKTAEEAILESCLSSDGGVGKVRMEDIVGRLHDEESASSTLLAQLARIPQHQYEQLLADVERERAAVHDREEIAAGRQRHFVANENDEWELNDPLDRFFLPMGEEARREAEEKKRVAAAAAFGEQLSKVVASTGPTVHAEASAPRRAHRRTGRGGRAQAVQDRAFQDLVHDPEAPRRPEADETVSQCSVEGGEEDCLGTHFH